MRIRQILFISMISIIPSCLFSQGLTYDEQMHDFGHIGMDFKIQHTYIFENRTDVPIKIKNIDRSEEHTSELQSHSFISYAVFCLKKKKHKTT